MFHSPIQNILSTIPNFQASDKVHLVLGWRFKLMHSCANNPAWHIQEFWCHPLQAGIGIPQYPLNLAKR